MVIKRKIKFLLNWNIIKNEFFSDNSKTKKEIAQKYLNDAKTKIEGRCESLRNQLININDNFDKQADDFEVHVNEYDTISFQYYTIQICV